MAIALICDICEKRMDGRHGSYIRTTLEFVGKGWGPEYLGKKVRVDCCQGCFESGNYKNWTEDKDLCKATPGRANEETKTDTES